VSAPPTASVPASDITPAPAASSPSDAATGTATMPPLKTIKDLERWMTPNCFAFSKTARQIACTQAPLDMGFTHASVTILSIDVRKSVASHVVYDGHSELEVGKLDGKVVAQVNERLASGGFEPGGKPFGAEAVVRTPDGYFRAEVEGTTMAYMIPKFTAGQAPTGFAGDPNACLRWEPSGGTSFGWAAAIRLESSHSFTTAAGPCQYADASDLNDETYPSMSRWLVVTAK
jgi:hypothetical protein